MKKKTISVSKTHTPTKKLLYWSLIVFLIKILIIVNISIVNFQVSPNQIFKIDGIWLGADGENYLKGYQALLQDGVFSPASILNFWPAGYPLILLALSIFGQSWVLTTLSVLQSLIFSVAVYFFAVQLLKTRINKFVYLIFLLILLNPTLSLSSMVLGYESLVASGVLLSTGIIIRDFIKKENKNFTRSLIFYSVISGLIIFLQPRMLVSSVIIMIYWVIIRKGLRVGSYIVILSLMLTLLIPSTLIYRNQKATGITSISTNLGATMNIGAGDKASGGYDDKNSGVNCDLSGSVSQQDSQRVKCVLSWYLDNPISSLKLFYNKSIYFWSPWSGPLTNGTMARNPWLKINPVINISSTNEGINLVNGGFGKLISWLWLLIGVGLLFFGFLKLWIWGSFERILGVMALIAMGSNWAISLITIGDHRFRLPIMGLSLMLQGVGLSVIFKGKSAKIAPNLPLR